MKRNTIRLTESDLHKIIKESVKRIIKERVLSQDEKFTPYTQAEAEQNRRGIWDGTPESRNPSYAKAKAAAQNRSKGAMEEDINEVGETEKGQAVLGALTQKREKQFRDNAQRYGTFSPQADKYYRKSQDAGVYAFNKRLKQPNGLMNPKDKGMGDAYQRGRQARMGYDMGRLSQDNYRNILNKGWK